MSTEEFASSFSNPDISFWPELRWWLAEGLHTDETLRGEIETAHRLGFGGMEFLAMDEAAVDHSRYGWGSEEWWHDSQLVAEETTKRSMSLSFTSGTNWSNANLPTITPDDPAAAQELDVVVEKVAGGARRAGEVPRAVLDGPVGMSFPPAHRGTITKQKLVAVIAVRVCDEPIEPPQQDKAVSTLIDGLVTPVALDAASTLVLTDQVTDGTLDWSAPDDGEWQLFYYWLHGTGQLATPSASQNVTVNYLDRAGVDAVIDYWRTVVLTPELRQQIANNPRVQMYMDSLELTIFGAAGLLWSQSFADEFRARRGYDIIPWLPFLNRSVMLMAVTTVYHYEPDAAHRDPVERVRFDYVRTLTDLYIENMLRPFTDFLHTEGMGLRSEISYGLPFELTRPGPEVDGIETESLEFGAQIDAYRLLAGPAHLFDKMYSSETGATTRNFIMDHQVYDQIIATQFAAGVTRTVLHGWSSVAGAEGMTSWPGHEGMMPMFSERFDTRQPGSEFYPLWTAAVARQQLFLRRGKPRIDVAILRTDHFVDNLLNFAVMAEDGRRIPDEEYFGTLLMRDRQNLWWRDLAMQDAGWSYDFFDPSLLLHDDVACGEGVLQPNGPGYQAVIVYQDTLDPDAARQLLNFARQGLRVVIVNGVNDNVFLMRELSHTHEHAAAATPGLDGRDAELADTMAALRAEPSVSEIDDPALTLDALRALGVRGRAEFVDDNESVLGVLRDDGDLSHLYLYHFLYETGEPTSVEVALENPGAVYLADHWTGQLHPHHGVREQDGRLIVTVRLLPGQTVCLTIDHSAPVNTSSLATETEIAVLDQWEITVESWDEGEPLLVTEDRGLGYETREIRPTTTATAISVGSGPLIPWREMPEVGPEVSGVAEYHTRYSLDAQAENTRYILDLGSTSGGLGAVRINDSDPVGFDTSAPRVDITDLIREGENRIAVRVASSLNNRLLSRGYYDVIIDIAPMIHGKEIDMVQTEPHAHGLVGPVRVLAVPAV